MAIEQRQFIRHPTSVPLQIATEPSSNESKAIEVSEGGLSFTCAQAYDIGKTVQITITICQPTFSENGIVRWCRKKGVLFTIGVSFEDESVAYTLRMVEQICHIESYQKQILAEKGIRLSSEQAAAEWIKHNAAKFRDSFY